MAEENDYEEADAPTSPLRKLAVIGLVFATIVALAYWAMFILPRIRD